MTLKISQALLSLPKTAAKKEPIVFVTIDSYRLEREDSLLYFVFQTALSRVRAPSVWKKTENTSTVLTLPKRRSGQQKSPIESGFEPDTSFLYPQYGGSGWIRKT